MDTYIATAFTPERISAQLADSHYVTFIAEAEADGDIVAYAQLHDTEPPPGVGDLVAVELVRLYVDRRYHGRGVAQRLMDLCLETARDRGAATLWLGVWEHNPRAQAFYAKYGFERVGEQVFGLGEEAQTDWVMRRLL